MAPFRSRGRGGRSATIFQNAFRNIISERPFFVFRAAALTLRARLLPLRKLRAVLLMSQPPLLEEEGNKSFQPWLYSIAPLRLLQIHPLSFSSETACFAQYP